MLEKNHFTYTFTLNLRKPISGQDNQVLRKFIYIFFSCFVLLTGCVNYSAGNRVTLDYVVRTNIDQDIIKVYLDTLILSGVYEIPAAWKQYDKLADLIPENTRRIYFSDNPREMYLIQFAGELLIADVYNPGIVDGDYISTPERMPSGGEESVRNRFEQVLRKIEKLAKRDGCPDSVLYFKTKYINGKWTSSPKWPK